MASVQVQNLANTPDTTPLIDKGTGNITFNWNQWLTNVQIKINTINNVLVQIAGAGTVSGAFNLLSPLTTNGDLLTYNANNNIRLGIGTTGQVITVVGGLPAWANPGASSPLTTKGDIYTFSTVAARLPVGADTYVLTASSGTTTGLVWAPAGTPTLPLTTRGDILGFSTVAARVPIGTDGQVLTADSTQTVGVKWAAVSGGSSNYLIPPFADVSSLLHFNGTNGSTTFTDQVAGNTWTANNATISTANYLFGGASGLFTGASNSSIKMPTNSGYNVGSGDWTIEFAINPTGTHQTGARIFQSRDGDVYAGFSITTSGQAIILYMSSTGSSWDLISGATLYTMTVGTWTRILLQRSTGVLSAFANGNLVYTNTSFTGTPYYNSGDSAVIGGNATGTSRSIAAYVDEFRFTKGLALVLSYPLVTGEFPNV